jgi:hypothetical protein
MTMTMCATSAGLRSVAIRERTHNDNPELASILDSVADEIDRLTRDLQAARAEATEVTRLRSYNEGLAKNVTELEARLNAKPTPEAILLQARPADGGPWVDIFPAQLYPLAKTGFDVRALDSDEQSATKEKEL